MDEKIFVIFLILGGLAFIMGSVVFSICIIIDAVAPRNTQLQSVTVDNVPNLVRPTSHYSDDWYMELTQKTTSTLLLGTLAGELAIAGGLLVDSEKRSWRITGSALGILSLVPGILSSWAGYGVGFALCLLGSVGSMLHKPPTKM